MKYYALALETNDHSGPKPIEAFLGLSECLDPYRTIFSMFYYM